MKILVASILFLAPADDPVRKTLEDFKSQIKDAKSVQEKALAIRAFSNVEPRDPSYAKEIGRFLAASPSDIHFLLPTTAIDALSRFRGSPAAAQAVLSALPAYRKTPHVHARLLPALGKIGHDSAFAAFEEMIRGRDVSDAVRAVEAVREMPAGPAVEFLFRQNEWVEKERPNASDKQRPVLDRMALDLTAALQDLTGEKYPANEMAIWWKKRGADFKKKAAEKEAELARTPRPPEPPGLPPLLIFDFPCNEGAGAATANLGSSSAHCGAAFVSPGPKWVAGINPSGGTAIDFGAKPGPHALDVPGGLEHLRNLKSFTIAGWIHCRDLAEGPGGNRLVTWHQKDREGVDLALRSDGALQLGINQAADASTAKSPPGLVPAGGDVLSWRFFAATYDSGLAAGHVKFYVGSTTEQAKPAGAVDCNRGPVGAKFAAALSIGNVPPSGRGAGDRAFRGIVDDVRIFGSVHDGAGALPLDKLQEVQGRVLRTPAR